MSVFVTVKDNIYEYTEQRSKFIGICTRVKTDGDAAEFLASLRKKYRDCTHICYAFVTDGSARSSDDGEPSGTAGMPIMECISGANLSQTLVAVVRYFGGIKLGAGGLLRAYTHVASQTLAGAARIESADCEIKKVSYDYAVYKKIEKRQLRSLYKLVSIEYNNTVEVTYATLCGSALESEILSLTQGKCTVTDLPPEPIERDIL